MRCTILLLFSLATVVAQAPEAVVPKAPSPPAAMQHIVEKDLIAHATFLASDELGGRLTASPGQVAAAKYIAAHFERLGLEPLGDEVEGKRGWFQHYGIDRTFLRDTTKLELGGLSLTTGFALLGAEPSSRSTSGTLRFCGLGRTSGERADVPADESLAGKIAVVVLKPRGKPPRAPSAEQKMMMSFAPLQRVEAVAGALGKKGAQAILFLQIADHVGFTDLLNYLAIAPGKDMLAGTFEGAQNQMAAMAGALAGSGEGPPRLVLSLPASAKLLAELGIDAEQLAAFVAGEAAAPAAKADVAAKVNLDVGREPDAVACNVVAVLRGSDPALAAEAIVYSAHMDHVGTRIDGDVFNGADDNASGSAGLMAIAAAFAKAGQKPKRSVIFLSVSGEELGLWGSAYFVDHPPWELDKIVADVNTDMIGRSGPESKPAEVTVTPSNDHRMFSTVVQDAARFGAELGLSFTSGDKYYMRSDHYNFAAKGIPVVFFCNGEHEDYHQVSDHADKFDGKKMEAIARLAFWTGWEVANAAERPRVLGVRDGWF